MSKSFKVLFVATLLLLGANLLPDSANAQTQSDPIMMAYYRT